MSEIHVLDQNTINQIAAGEVVERPASVVKELVENAVDARSTAITVEIKGGGIDFIRITDNGMGIPKDQIKKAFLRHATSKIQSADDLLGVKSLGFRGEALSSICAVSKVELITKTDEGISGVRYVIEGGEEVSYEEIGCPEGTTFVVRNLFYNTPARRKFLKSAMTEAGYVEAFVQRLALSRPDISFKFISDNKNKISTAGNGNLKDVIYHIFGRDIAMNLLPVDHEEAGINVRGYMGKPVISRGNRNYEHYFVGGRYLKNNIIARAIEDGCKGRSMVHKFPFAVLMIEMDSRLYDVNVHPAKMEMRFKNAEELYSTVSTAVRSSFIKKELIQRITLGKEEEKQKNQKEKGNKKGSPEPFEKKRREIEARFAGLSKERIKEIEQMKKTGAGDPGLFADPAVPYNATRTGADNISGTAVGIVSGTAVGIVSGTPINNVSGTAVDNVSGTAVDNKPGTSLDNKPGTPDVDKSGTPAGKSAVKPEDVMPPDTAKALAGDQQDSQGMGMTNDPEKAIKGKQMSFTDVPFLAEEARPRHRIIGQVFRTYWLVEYEDQLFFVDQHAAHEKVMYEKLKKNLEDKRIDRQLVAPPIVLNFSMKEKSNYLKWQDAFAAMGYQIEEFGEDAYCIRAVPANLYGIDQQELFVELLDQLGEGSSGLDTTAITDRLASMACKAAVKGNQTMTTMEMDSLMDQLLKLENPYQCPHGRPTIISMTKYELEKKFKRIQ